MHKLPEVFSVYFTLNHFVYKYRTKTRYDLYLPSPYSFAGTNYKI